MATKITVTKELESRLRRIAAEEQDALGSFAALTARQLIARLDDARQREKKSKGLTPQEAISIVRGVLGPAVVMPVEITPAFRGMVSGRISMLGLTAEEVESAAYRAKNTLRLPTSLYYVFQIMDRLVSPGRETMDAGLVLGEAGETPAVKIRTGRDGE